MANLSLQAFKKKWADLTGRFKDNSTFDIAEKEYRELSADIADSLFEPVESLRARVEKLEQPAPPAPEGVKWKVYPKVSIEGNNVKVTVSEIEAHGQALPLPTPNAKDNVPLPPAGWGTRIDILAATATGWEYIFGEDPWVTPAMVIEDQPEAELLFAAYLFWSNAGGVVEEPVVFVKVVEMDGQEYAPDANGRLILPKGGTTINSTDDIQSEGATNKWWTELRTITSRATANLWSYIGLADSNATITLKGWLDFLTNKVQTNEVQIALRVRQVKQGTTTYSPDATGVLTLPTAGASPIPKGRTNQSSSVLNFSQSTIQERTLTSDLVITSISNPQLDEGITLLIDSTANNFNFVLPSSCKALNGGGFGLGVLNSIYLHCIATSGPHMYNVSYNV